MDTLPRYLTPVQVGQMLQVSPRTVERWALEDASMPATRLGRVIRFEHDALMRWLGRKQPRRAAQAQRKGGVPLPKCPSRQWRAPDH